MPMKTVIFAGGMGSRISEESHLKPKPMIEIGGKPMLWHIMKIYQCYGFNEFVICLGYKGYIIKEYFANYFLYNADVTFDLSCNKMHIHRSHAEDLTVTLVDTGLHTMTAGRLKRVQSYIGEEDFMLTYGDGLCNVNIRSLVAFHQHHGKTATVTGIQPRGKFGVMNVSKSDAQVQCFTEKPKESKGWVNGGFFVLKPKVFDYLEEEIDHIMWEQNPMRKLANNGELMMYRHEGFWKCMDILRDKIELEEMWKNNPQWKKW